MDGSLHEKNLPCNESLDKWTPTNGSFAPNGLAHLEQLHSDDGEHELEQAGDEHDVADGLHRHDDALHDVLHEQIETGLGGGPSGGRPTFSSLTLSPLARLMARSGLSTRSTRRIFTTEMAPELRG